MSGLSETPSIDVAILCEQYQDAEGERSYKWKTNEVEGCVQRSCCLGVRLITDAGSRQ